MPKVNKSKCTGCQTCVAVCPVTAINMKNNKANIDQKKCIKCGACVVSCPEKAIDAD